MKRPKFQDLGVLKRNQDWLNSKMRKLELQRKMKKAHETDGCTFEPKINRSRPEEYSKLSARTNISIGSKTNRSYSEIHRDRSRRGTPMERSFQSMKQSSAHKPQILQNKKLDDSQVVNLEAANTISFEPCFKGPDLTTPEYM
jgi:beta-xylosidase